MMRQKKEKKCANVGTIQKTFFTTLAILATYLQESMSRAIASAVYSTVVLKFGIYIFGFIAVQKCTLTILQKYLEQAQWHKGLF